MFPAEMPKRESGVGTVIGEMAGKSTCNHAADHLRLSAQGRAASAGVLERLFSCRCECMLIH